MSALAKFQKIIDRVYPPATFKEQLLIAYPGHASTLRGYESYGKPPKVVYTAGPEGVSLIVTQPILSTLLKCSIRPVEYCCAMMSLYNFATAGVESGTAPMRLPKEVLKELMDLFIAHHAGNTWFTSQRLIVNMVEYGRSPYSDDPLVEVLPIENPKMMYHALFEYFHENAARVNTMLMRNANGGNIIHHMEVLFAPDYFKEVLNVS